MRIAVLLDFDEARVGDEMCVGQNAFIADDKTGARPARLGTGLPGHGVVLTLAGDVDFHDGGIADGGGPGGECGGREHQEREADQRGALGD